jgi:lysozyme
MTLDIPIMNDPVVQQIKIDEGFRTYAYKDTQGNRTIGYGYNLDANPLALDAAELQRLNLVGVSEPKACEYIVRTLEIVRTQLKNHFEWYEELPENPKQVLDNMTYNLGIGGILEFKKFLYCLWCRDYQGAAHEMQYSKWYKQTGNRAARLVEKMKNG